MSETEHANQKPLEEPAEPVQTAEQPAEPEPISFAEFLEGRPPKIADLFQPHSSGRNEWFYTLQTPELSLHCTDTICNGMRLFRSTEKSEISVIEGKAKFIYLRYRCSNCQQEYKMFSLHLLPDGVFGKERETFLKGRRCENQGLGIGAFGYYRRVVENQKKQILDEIIRVSQKIDAPGPMIAALTQAKDEVQFTKALASVKDAIPQALLINGQNPLTLLHSALSIGLHEQTDERCLELAHDVRIVLTELAERLGQALKDEAELNTAVSRLMQAKANK
jgi:hypothetical protein